MTTMASQITSLTVVYATVYSDADERKHQSSASLAFVWGIHRDRWIRRRNGQLRRKCFHLMTSSWVVWHGNLFRITNPFMPRNRQSLDSLLIKAQQYGTFMFSLLLKTPFEQTIGLSVLGNVVNVMWRQCIGLHCHWQLYRYSKEK